MDWHSLGEIMVYALAGGITITAMVIFNLARHTLVLRLPACMLVVMTLALGAWLLCLASISYYPAQTLSSYTPATCRMVLRELDRPHVAPGTPQCVDHLN